MYFIYCIHITPIFIPYCIDYVVFPMSYDLKDGKIRMAFGHQDIEGWVGILSVQEVLESLKKI